MRRLGWLRSTVASAVVATAALGVLGGGEAAAQGKQLTLCWAAWDPANALVELGKDFTKQSGIEMKYEFVPWTSYADRFLNELNSHGKLCDLIIGDSQWIGGAAENKWYVKLNDFFDKEKISMGDFVPATVVGYSQWPKNTPNYWALPAMADAVGWTYRKDWFSRPEIQSAFKAKYGRDLAPPKTYDELKQVAEFFQGREIDGKKVYGAYIFTERGSEGITMGVTNVLYNYGFAYDNPKKPYQMQGIVNSADAAKGLEFYKELYKCCTAPGMTNAYMQEGLDAFKSGQVAMQMNWFRLLPRPLQGSECRRRQDRLLRQPGRSEGAFHAARRAGHLGGGNLRPQGRRARLHQMVRAACRAAEMVADRRLLGAQGGGRRARLPEERGVRAAIPGVDGHRQGLLGRAVLRAAAARHAEAGA